MSKTIRGVKYMHNTYYKYTYVSKYLYFSDKLPVPAIFETKTDNNDKLDDVDDHGGRIRTFPHERGNWSTYVFIPCMIHVFIF